MQTQRKIEEYNKERKVKEELARQDEEYFKQRALERDRMQKVCPVIVNAWVSLF